MLIRRTSLHILEYSPGGTLRLAEVETPHQPSPRAVELRGVEALGILDVYRTLERHESRAGCWGPLGGFDAVFDSIAREQLSHVQMHAIC